MRTLTVTVVAVALAWPAAAADQGQPSSGGAPGAQPDAPSSVAAATLQTADARATRPVAAWDVVPYQVFDAPFGAGVVAFHETGCKVEFSVVAGGREIAALSRTADGPTLNPRTGIWEFWTMLDPQKLPDGPVEVRAKVVPLGTGMLSRDLEPIMLYANAGGTLKLGQIVWVDCEKGDDLADGSQDRPLRTIKAGVARAGDGGTVYLKPGKAYSSHALAGGLKRNYWTTIAAAPGARRDDVEIGPGRPGTDKLRFRNVTLYTDPPSRAYNTILSGEQGRTIVWLDQCKLYNKKGRWDGGGVVFGNRYVSYVTGGLTTEMDNGPTAVLMRHHRIERITSDAFTGVQTAIGCSVEDIDPGKTGAHPDFHQSYSGDPEKFNSVILYNCWGKRCVSQGFFGHNLRDSAFVNCLFHKGDTVMFSQYSGPLDHVLFIHISLPNQTWLWRDGLKATNCYMINCLIASMSQTKGSDTSGLVFDANHFLKTATERGDGATAGPAEFMDPDRLDFRLKAGQAAAAGGKQIQCVPADIAGRPYEPQNRSRGCWQAGAGAPWWLAMPHDTAPRILQWAGRHGDIVSLASEKTRGGHTAYAVTVTDRESPASAKKRLVFSQPHAHEPATTAAMMEVLAQLVEGRRLDGRPADIDRRSILNRAVLTFIPDGNPDGRSRSPEPWWDGLAYTNDQFLQIAFGRTSDGQRFPRQGRWSTPDQQPSLLGIVYEQITDREFVEPNRDRESTFFRLLQSSLERGGVNLHVDLHQTEFDDSDRNAMVILPFMQNELPAAIQKANVAAAEAIISAWRAGGARPVAQARPLGYHEDQIRYFRQCWAEIYRTTPHVTVEVQNNCPRTPPLEQMRLTEIAIRASIELVLSD